MDDVESIELVEESLVESPDCSITVLLSFKSGLTEKITFKAPAWVPIYGEPITGESIYLIMAEAYSYGEAPFLALPTAAGFRFVDLSSTNFVDVEVVYD